MRTREMKASDYGMSNKEVKKLCKLCKKSCPKLRSVLREAAYMANPVLAADIIRNLTEGISFENLCKERYIPAQKKDFYPYRLKCLAYFKHLLKECGDNFCENPCYY